jgi:hypothetical protein
MKTQNLIFLIFLLVFPLTTLAQGPQTEQQAQDERIFVVTKNDGTRYVGQIISQDAREVLIETAELGQVYIPRHEIREIREAAQGEISSKGAFTPAEVFSTRYFITTNGLPIKKGETYMLMSLLGPDFQFGVADNFGLGIITSWIGSPMIATAKYSVSLNENISAGVGLLAGIGSWAIPGFRLILPYGVFTAGDRVKNINLSLGYGGITIDGESEGNFLISVAGMAKVGGNVSLVFDTFIVPRSGTYQDTEWFGDGMRNVTRKRHSVALIIPGIRFQTNPKSAFQFGFAGLRAEGETVPVPFPMVQWFRQL